MTDLFSALRPEIEPIRDGVTLLPGFCEGDQIYNVVQDIVAEAPFRHMVTPGGRPMAVAITNCGKVGWVSDSKGYRYSPVDTLSHKPWPDMPDSLFELAQSAANKAGFTDFRPDSCLINRYDPTARLSPHQDKDEQDFDQPIVSVSLGLSAVFQMYGPKRGGTPINIRLDDGDVLVFGGPARLFFHGVRKLLSESPDHLTDSRINLTFRRAMA